MTSLDRRRRTPASPTATPHTVLIADFPDAEAYRRYAQDPVHLAVIAEHVRPVAGRPQRGAVPVLSAGGLWPEARRT